MAAKEDRGKYLRTHSKILIRLTILISVVVIVMGIATFLLFRGSQQRLIDESIRSLVETHARNFASSYQYISELLYPEYAEIISSVSPQEIYRSLQDKEISEVQKTLDASLTDIVESGYMGLEVVLIIMPPSTYMPTPVTLASSNESLIYNSEIPAYIGSAIEEDLPYLYREEGVPELGIEDECLLTLGQSEIPSYPGMQFTYVGIKPMHEEVAAMNSFFDQEKKSANLMLGIVLGASIVIIILITFFLLNFLIKRRITQPIEKLSDTANEAMQGNLDVEIEITKGEEFETLKWVFRDLVNGIRLHIARSVGEEGGTGEEEISQEPTPRGRRKPRILYEITLVLVVVIIAYGLSTFFILRRTQENLISDITDRIVQAEAEDFFSGLSYATQIGISQYSETIEKADANEVMEDLLQERISDIQKATNNGMHDLVASGYFGLRKMMLIIPPMYMYENGLVYASSDESLIFKWEIPDDILQIIKEETPYLLRNQGVPELGLEGEYLVSNMQIENKLHPQMPFNYVALKPIQDELAAIDEFYDQERARANLLLAIMLGCFIISIILISFFYLNHLIRKQITQPIDDLSAAAEKVIQGDLYVQVPVQEGEELEVLKRAFNEMVESFRKYIPHSNRDA